jgi:hypothetical protein
MRSLFAAVIATCALGLSAGMAVGQSNNANPNAPGQDRVCLITFGSHDQANAGADADIISTKYLPRKAAEAQADFDQGGAVRIYEYGDDTEQTCDRLGGRS